MSYKDVIMAAVAALLGGVVGAYVLDRFPQITGAALSLVGLHAAEASTGGGTATDYTRFAALPGDSDAALKRKKEACWVAAYAEFPIVAQRIPLGKDAGLLVRDNAFPSDDERSQFKTFMSVIPACRSLTKAYDRRTIPPTQHALLAKLDEVFREKDRLYRTAIDGEVRWGDFAQQLIDIDRDLSQFRKQMRSQSPPPAQPQ